MLNNEKKNDFKMTMEVVNLREKKEPSIANFTCDYGNSGKVTKKSRHGQIELETYFDDKLNMDLCAVNLRLKGLPPEVAHEILRVLKPFFKNPVNPQLELFPVKEED